MVESVPVHARFNGWAKSLDAVHHCLCDGSIILMWLAFAAARELAVL
jgi:hypothetical protein